MKISLEWLREYVDYQGDAKHLGELLTQAGLAVEHLEQTGDDWVLDIEVTSNRSDCLGHIGIAREVAAITANKFHLPPIEYHTHGQEVNQWTSVTNKAPELCGRYTARVIDGVKIGPSPDWLRRRLEAIGLRSINNVVDITNYVLMEIGQPLHSFDYDRLKEGRIEVRLARPGEQMVMIDHSKIELNNQVLVIADGEGPAALAGVMGGLASEVSDDTKTILLESAHFDPLSIRRTARALALGSESSYRFERNVDMVMVDWASQRATALLEQLAGGRAAPGVIDIWPGKKPAREVSLRLSRMKTLLGIIIEKQFVLTVLERLGFAPKVDEADVIKCTVPSWRNDVSREVDLIEEVIRIYGYGHIPTEKKIHITVKTVDSFQRTRQKVTNALNSCGYFETINVSFVDDKYLTPFAGEDFAPVRVLDMTRKSNNALRPSLLPSLLLARKNNQDAGNDHCNIYELAAVYQPGATDPVPQEAMMLGILSDDGLRHLRGVIEAIISSLNKNVELTCQPVKVRWAREGTGAKLSLKGQVLGYAGQAGKSIIESFDIKQDEYLAQINFSELEKLEGQTIQYRPIGRFPGINRDLSLVLEEQISWEQIQQAIQEIGIADLRQVQFVDIYRGPGIEAGKKSMTLSLEFRREQETLTHEQVDEYQNQVLEEMIKKFHARLRE